MEDGLAARHPELTTYAGRAVGDPTATIRLDLTPMGFHASVRGSGERAAWYVDPAWNGDDSLYLSYRGTATCRAATAAWSSPSSTRTPSSASARAWPRRPAPR